LLTEAYFWSGNRCHCVGIPCIYDGRGSNKIGGSIFNWVSCCGISGLLVGLVGLVLGSDISIDGLFIGSNSVGRLIVGSSGIDWLAVVTTESGK
jgi:hypothetical protein